MKLFVKSFFAVAIVLSLEGEVVAHNLVQALELASLLPINLESEFVEHNLVEALELASLLPSDGGVQNQQKMCNVCADEFDASEFPLKCGHDTCKGCLTAMAKIACDDNSAQDLNCPECKRKIEFDELKAVVQGDFALMDRLNEIVKKDCSTIQRHYVDKSKPRKAVRCEFCNQDYCSHCSLIHDLNITCEQAKAANTQDDDWILENTKPCPKCNVRIEKAKGGCDRVTCSQCNESFCWRCNFHSPEMFTVYDHLNNSCPVEKGMGKDFNPWGGFFGGGAPGHW